MRSHWATLEVLCIQLDFNPALVNSLCAAMKMDLRFLFIKGILMPDPSNLRAFRLFIARACFHQHHIGERCFFGRAGVK